MTRWQRQPSGSQKISPKYIQEVKNALKGNGYRSQKALAGDFITLYRDFFSS